MKLDTNTQHWVNNFSEFYRLDLASMRRLGTLNLQSCNSFTMIIRDPTKPIEI